MEKFISEDRIVEFLKTKNALFHTRKYSNVNEFMESTNIKQPDYICITGYTQILSFIFTNIIDKIKNPIILITIESDVIDFKKEYLSHTKLKHWFSWNKSIKHPKLTCIPIGLNEDRHMDAMNNTINEHEENLKEKKLLLVNFNPATNNERRKFFDYARKNWDFADILPHTHFPCEKSYFKKSLIEGQIKIEVTSKDFYKELREYKFALSPAGAGIDCHRTWECLYLGVIPIVRKSEINEIYKNLPILVVDDWKDINEEMLQINYKKIKSINKPNQRAYLDFWTKLITISAYKKTLINYANNVYFSQQKLNSRTGITHGGFDRVIEYNPTDIDKEFRSQHKKILDQPRGNGYWLWKPYFLLKTLQERIEYGEYLMYADSGAFFIKPIDEVILEMENQNEQIGCFEIFGNTDKTWTKRDTYIIMDADTEEYANSFQRMGGFQIIKKTEKTIEFYKELLKYSIDLNCITDIPCKFGENYKQFRDHRHDQSIFSLLTKKNGIKCLKDISHWQFESWGKDSAPGDYGIIVYGKNWQLVRNKFL